MHYFYRHGSRSIFNDFLHRIFSIFKKPRWSVENITKNAIKIPEPVGYESTTGYTIDISSIRVPYRAPYHVFGRTISADLIHFSKKDEGWTQTSVTKEVYKAPGLIEYYNISGSPETIVDPDHSIHIYGINTYAGGHLIHHKGDLNPENPSERIWSAHYPHRTRFDKDEYHLLPSYFSINKSPTGDLHIVGLHKSKQSLVHFYTVYSHAWHSNKEYSRWASGNYYNFKYEPKKKWKKDGKTIWAYAYAGIFRTDRAEMWCPSFHSNSGPARRAAIMLHEATHIHYADDVDVWNGDHDPKDEWYHHGLDAIPWGTLRPTLGLKHSMYQIQVEFLADISEFPYDWVPKSIRDSAKNSAKNSANHLIDTRFSVDSKICDS